MNNEQKILLIINRFCFKYFNEEYDAWKDDYDGDEIKELEDRLLANYIRFFYIGFIKAINALEQGNKELEYYLNAPIQDFLDGLSFL